MTTANQSAKAAKVESFGPITKEKAPHARMSIYDKHGKVLDRWGTPQVTARGSFAAPQGLALDSKNDFYVSEVTWTFAVSRGHAPADCHTFQKFSLGACSVID